MWQLRISDTVLCGGFPVLAFDLSDVLRALGTEVFELTWFVCRVEGEHVMASGSGATELEALERSGAGVTGRRLLGIAEQTHQVIWGEFRAFLGDGRTEPHIRIIAFDSSYFDVWCGDQATLAKIAADFKDTTITPLLVASRPLSL